MFLYVNYRKNNGLVCHHGFFQEEKVAKTVILEIQNLISANKQDYGLYAPSSNELDNFILSLHKPDIAKLKELIQKYENWASPFYGPALLHDIQEHYILSDD